LFFFQAEDGIRHLIVTGVQTCALPISPAGTTGQALTRAVRDAVLAMVTVLRAIGSSLKDLSRSVTARLGEHPDGTIFTSLPRPRSEERRVGKECRWGEAAEEWRKAA